MPSQNLICLCVAETRAKAANKAGDSDRFQNITIPVVMPQIEAAVVYALSSGLSRVNTFDAIEIT